MSSLYERKHRQIIEAAIEVFLKSGFEGTSMDRVAEHAGMSKVTVYNHFKDKRDLFKKVMEVHCQNLEKNAPKINYGLDKPLEENLKQFAEILVTGLLNPKSVKMLRVVIFETGQFPELSSLIWVDGKLPMLDAFCEYLDLEIKQGRLKISNTYLAARQFFGMIKENLVWPVLMGVRLKVSSSYRDEVIQNSVKMFLNYYSPHL